MRPTPIDTPLVAACQEIGRHLLSSFSAVCVAHNLTYHLGGGTLLGAVRSGRFIPWDDDVDVSMPRSDFERLTALATENPHLFGTDVAFDPQGGGWQRGLLSYLASDSPRGRVSLDIFAIDPIPSGRWRRAAVERAAWLSRMGVVVLSGVGPPTTRGEVLHPLLKLIGPARLRAAHLWVLDYAARRSDGSTLNCLNGSRPMGRSRPSSWYEGDRTAWFEGQQHPVPTNAEDVLALLYGPDYMVPRPGSPVHYPRPFRAEIHGRRWVLDAADSAA